jgi:hypothetical protein
VCGHYNWCTLKSSRTVMAGREFLAKGP